MARIELNLWDADRVKIVEGEILIEFPSNQLHIILPKELELPAFDWLKPEEIVLEVNEFCGHRPIMHRISGGCNASGCLCNKTRNDSDECTKGANS